ncbi:HlyU family transcriptional regulator [Oceaniglobus roseus]|uniref:HlyU family transcriptional regulator n=1 Tax=Oceaniglobus roseus TaxID=1737570 RepID=UPI000C7E86F2|nr:HlyU family transcriptional regulator [Kandeliimicrobium roseum]
MSILSRLFGGNSGKPKAAEEAAAETYEGFRIVPTPMDEGATYRVCARIEKEVGGETKSHTLIRSDTLPGREEAVAASIRKAKQLIDERGERLFD